MCTCISAHQQPGCVCLHVCLCASVCVFVRCLCSMHACTSQVLTDFNGEMFGMSDICVPWDLLLLSEVIKGMKPADSSWRANQVFIFAIIVELSNNVVLPEMHQGPGIQWKFYFFVVFFSFHTSFNRRISFKKHSTCFSGLHPLSKPFFFTIFTFFPFKFHPSSCFLLVWVLNRVDYTVSLCGWNAALNL